VVTRTEVALNPVVQRQKILDLFWKNSISSRRRGELFDPRANFPEKADPSLEPGEGRSFRQLTVCVYGCEVEGNVAFLKGAPRFFESLIGGWYL
jgi:hypothetical protein